MQDIQKIDPDIFRFTVTSLMGALAGRFPVDMKDSSAMQHGVEAMSDMAVLMAQTLLSKTEGAGVLVVHEGHPVLAARCCCARRLACCCSRRCASRTWRATQPRTARAWRKASQRSPTARWSIRPAQPTESSGVTPHRAATSDGSPGARR